MKLKLLLLFWVVLCIAPITRGQVSNQLTGAGAPTGSCTSTQQYLDSTNHVLYYCNNNTWSVSQGLGNAQLTVPGGTTVSGSDITFPGKITAGTLQIPSYISIPTSDLFIGTTGGAAGNATMAADKSVGIGTNALASLTVPSGGSLPAGDTAIGYNACPLVTTAREMVCIGHQAGASFVGNGQNTQDGLSTFIGSYAGQALTGSAASATDFVCIGQKSCTGTTGGGASIFLGNHAGAGVLTGSRSIIIGNTTLDVAATATSSDDVIIGYNAAHAGTGVFSGNILIGKDVGSAASALVNDTVIGFQSGLALTTGVQNTFLGTQAGRAISNSSTNTFIGYQAGLLATGGNQMAIGAQSCANMTGGSNNFSECLGNSTNLAAAGDTNEIVIGQAATGAGSNTATIGSSTVTDVFEGGAAAAAKEHAAAYLTATNCSSSASPAVCGSASAGSFVIAAGATTVTVNTTAVTANSSIIPIEDDSLGTKLSVTCNTATAVPEPNITARVGGTSFSVGVTVAPVTNPKCYSFFIVN